ncbi:GINS complex subunit [Xylographa pallens]|nr:GINS complex subunit [Xylographa pallens]
MDISDILTSVSAHSPLPAQSLDLQALTRAWVNERVAPEVLLWPEELMARVMRGVAKLGRAGDGEGMVDWSRGQGWAIALMALRFVDRAGGRADRYDEPENEFPGRYHANGAGAVEVFGAELFEGEDREVSISTLDIPSILYQLKRVFIILNNNPQISPLTAFWSSQIDKHILHYLTSNQRARLSTSEVQYATTHQSLLHAHYHSSFLAQFPVGLQKLDDTAGGIAMVEVPDAEKAVFVRGLRSDPVRVSVEGTDMDFQVGRGEVVVVRWSAVKSAVEDGDLECV